jgi:hypothetical protein
MSEAEQAPEAAPESLPPPPPVSAREAVSVAFAVTIAAGAVLTFAFDPVRAGQPTVVGSIGALYALIALVALVRLRRRGELFESARVVRGDISLAALVAGLCYGLCRVLLPLLAPHGSPREAWVLRVYLQIGDVAASGRLAVGLAVFGVAALEEIAWRGLVLRTLEDAFGPRRALVYTTLLYGLAHAPTVFLLRDPSAGLNPLVLLAALGCGLLWGGLAVRAGRLVPSVLAHGLFTWTVIELPFWRP